MNRTIRSGPSQARALVKDYGIVTQRCVRINLHEAGFSPNQIYHARRTLRDLRRYDLGPRNARRDWAVYVWPGTSAFAIDKFQASIPAHLGLFNETLGPVGEQFLRSELLKASQSGAVHYKYIPRSANAGFTVLGGHKVDLTAAWAYQTRFEPLAIEVKNEAMAYGPDALFSDGRSALGVCIKVGLDTGRLPVFACAYASEKCRDFCSVIGMPQLAWGHQILPAGKKGIVDRQFRTLGTSNFEYAARRPFQSQITATAQQDIASLSDPRFIADAADRWAFSRSILPAFVDEMIAGETTAFYRAAAAVRECLSMASNFDDLLLAA